MYMYMYLRRMHIFLFLVGAPTGTSYSRYLRKHSLIDCARGKIIEVGFDLITPIFIGQVGRILPDTDTRRRAPIV